MPKPPAPFVSEDSEACFTHFAKLVAALPDDELEHYTADPEIVRVNLVRGVDAIRPHVDRIAQALPLVSLPALLELPSLSLALGFAADRVFTAASPMEIRARQARLRPARSRTLRFLEIAAELDLVPADRVKKIRADRGPIDEARDGVAIVACFREYDASLAGKHPFPKEALAQLAEDGNWLLQQLLPSGATPEKGETNPDTRVRDQLWTEIVRRYDLLYQAGMVIWGRRGVDAHIPALQSRIIAASPKAAKDPAGAAPGPADAGGGEKPA